MSLRAHPKKPLPPHSLGVNSMTFSSLVPMSVFLSTFTVMHVLIFCLTSVTIDCRLSWLPQLTSPNSYMASPTLSPAVSAGESAITSLIHAKGILSS